nr:uncharacterized protein LOC113690926 isoform X1 [Coffea arabica]
MAHLKLQEKLVFAVTNLGTRIAVGVSQESTVGDFKRKFEMAHLNCFPEHGKVRVCGLKVRKKSCFYYLSESFVLKHAFQGANGWFLYIAVCHIQDQTVFVAAAKKNSRKLRRRKLKMKKLSCFKAACLDIPRTAYFSKREKKNCNRVMKNITAKCPTNRIKQRHLSSQESILPFAPRVDRQGDRSSAIECPSETISGTVSISGIINRYFSGYDEVTSNLAFSCMELQQNNKENMKAQFAIGSQNIQVGIPSSLVPKTPPQRHSLSVLAPNSRASRDAPREKVGMHLVEASVNLGLFKTKQNPSLSLCKDVDGRSGLSLSANNPIRTLVFEITDEDD